MSDSGRAVGVTNRTFTLSDTGATRLPNIDEGTPGPIQDNTTYRPTSAENTSDSFPSPAPGTPYNQPAPVGSATFASVFNGLNPNGAWSLYIVDDVAGLDNWSITGWDLIITVAVATPTATTLTSSLNPSFATAPNNSVTFTATVTSGGSPVTVGTVTFRQNGVQIGSPVNLNGSGQAQTTTTFATEGVKNITATYDGTASFATSSVSLSQTVDNHTTNPSPNTFCNPGSNSITAASPVATIYPQRIFTSGLGGSLTTVSLQLNGLSISAGNGLDVLLVAPNGAAYSPMSDAGGGLPASSIALTLTDAAGQDLPQSGALSSGSFRPRNYVQVSDNDTFPAPAPSTHLDAAPAGSATFTSAFAGGAPNGTWSLFLRTDTGGDTASTTSYCISLSTSSDVGTTTTVSSSPNPSLRNNPVTITAQVRRTDNSAPVTSGTVTFTENATVLAGPTALSPSGTASFSTSTLTEGAHTITATYNGVPGSFNVSFGTVSQQVDNPTVQSGNQYCNNGGITIPANGNAQPYGQRILVSGAAGVLENLTVNLNSLTQPRPVDWDLLLVGPAGQKYVLMGDAGGNAPVSGISITLSDAGVTLPSNAIVNGTTYRPALYEGVNFPAPAPAPPYSLPAPAGSATFGATFGGSDPNGYWSLYVADDVGGELSSIGSYCLNLTITPPSVTITKTHTGNFKQGQTAAVYTIHVTNDGPGATQGTVQVDDTLPAGLTATNLQGSGWTCGLSPLRCTRTDSLAAGVSYPDITLTVSVSGTAAASVTNTASVSGGGDTTPSAANDQTTIIGVSDMTVTKSHSGNFTQGQQGSYSITARNSGSGPTDASVTVSDNLPAGLTIVSISGSGWSCTAATASCTRADVLAANTNYPAITVVVAVSASAPASVTNQAVVTGGGELNNGNNVANDPTTIEPGTLVNTVSTNPAGLSFVIDGTTFTTQQSPAWAPGSSHTIGTTSPQAAAGTQYLFQNWSDGGAISHSVVAPNAATSYVANFKTQYQLTTTVAPVGAGTAGPSGFFDAGSIVSLSAVPAACFTFGSWSANAPGGSVTLNAPQTVTATFVPFIASNVSAGVTFTPGTIVFNRSTGRFVQQVTLTNNTGGPLTDVLFIADNLTAGVSIANGTGVTACAAPAGVAFFNVGSIAAGASSQFFVQFNNPSRGAILYAPRVLAGPGQP